MRNVQRLEHLLSDAVGGRQVVVSVEGSFEHAPTDVAGRLRLGQVNVFEVPVCMVLVVELGTTAQAHKLVPTLGDALDHQFCRKEK